MASIHVGPGKVSGYETVRRYTKAIVAPDSTKEMTADKAEGYSHMLDVNSLVVTIGTGFFVSEAMCTFESDIVGRWLETRDKKNVRAESYEGIHPFGSSRFGWKSTS